MPKAKREKLAPSLSTSTDSVSPASPVPPPEDPQPEASAPATEGSAADPEPTPYPATPRGYLLSYQSAWIDDATRFKIGLMARQTGKSFTTAMEAVQDCRHRKTMWVCMSAGERQALEWMMKAREHAEALHLSADDYTEIRDSEHALLKSAEIRWPNGSRLVAIPANPATGRGYSANLVLDEFAFHEDPDAIWRAIYPSISNPLKGPFKIRVVSTPNGLGNKFANLWEKAEGWARHKITIHDAVRLGLPVDVEELRRGLDDPEAWAQEYECEFLNAAAVLLPYELIARCEAAEASTDVDPGYFQATRPLYLGIDFARKHDLSVALTLERVGEIAHTVEVLEMRGQSTPDQVAALRPRIQAARRVCLDYTGPGVGMGDYLVEEFGEYAPERHLHGKIELLTFTNPTKVDLFSKLRMAFESTRLRVPVHRAFREDLHSIQRVTTPSGTVTYRAPHTADGHADRATALALAWRAYGSGGSGAINADTVGQIRVGGSGNARPQFQPGRWA